MHEEKVVYALTKRLLCFQLLSAASLAAKPQSSSAQHAQHPKMNKMSNEHSKKEQTQPREAPGSGKSQSSTHQRRLHEAPSCDSAKPLRQELTTSHPDDLKTPTTKPAQLTSAHTRQITHH